MHPAIADIVNTSGHWIARWRWHLFFNRFVVAFNAGAGLINCLNWWAHDSMVFAIVAAFQFGCAFWIHRLSAVISKRIHSLTAMRQPAMRLDSATTTSELECYHDQLLAHLKAP